MERPWTDLQGRGREFNPPPAYHFIRELAQRRQSPDSGDAEIVPLGTGCSGSVPTSDLRVVAEVVEAEVRYLQISGRPGKGLREGLRFSLREHPCREGAAHYHLAAMHPFVDGNGRTARALEALMRERAGLRVKILLKNGTSLGG